MKPTTSSQEFAVKQFLALCVRDFFQGAVAFMFLLLAANARLPAADWLAFRGADGMGIAANEKMRTSWSETEGIAWRAKLPGKGVSSPIVVGPLVVVTASSGPQENRLHVIALNRNDGSTVWHRQFFATGRTLCHPTSAVAAGTPASDGKRIVALFSSCDLFAIDLGGGLLWQRSLAVERPKAGNDIGMASSPRIIDGTVVIQIESQGDSFASGIDVITGEDRWTVPRRKAANWTTPTAIVGSNGKAHVLLQDRAGVEVRSASSGALVWELLSQMQSIPSASVRGNVVYLPSENEGIVALTLSASDEKPQRTWASVKLSPGSASPLAWNEQIACVNRAGVLTIASSVDGTVGDQVRLAGQFWASPILVGKLIVAVNREGTTFLVSAGEKPEIIAKNILPGTFLGTPAIADGSLYLRSEDSLWKITADPTAQAITSPFTRPLIAGSATP